MKNNFKAHLLQLKAYPDNILGYTLFLCSNYLAIFGGLVLLSIVLINFLSIIGRILFSNPLVGDFELVEMGHTSGQPGLKSNQSRKNSKQN